MSHDRSCCSRGAARQGVEAHLERGDVGVDPWRADCCEGRGLHDAVWMSEAELQVLRSVLLVAGVVRLVGLSLQHEGSH